MPSPSKTRDPPLSAVYSPSRQTYIWTASDVIYDALKAAMNAAAAAAALMVLAQVAMVEIADALPDKCGCG